jgi:hypothetical protein
MPLKKNWTKTSLLSCLVLNAILLSLLFFMAKQVLAALHQWVAPFLTPGASNLPTEAHSAFGGLHQLIAETEQYLAPVVFGVGIVVTVLLWMLLRVVGSRLLSRTEHEIEATAPAESTIANEGVQATGHLQEPSLEAKPGRQPSLQNAVQMLAILQREGRLVDFLREDLHLYTDDQIGAAVRSIHQGCQAALFEHLDLKPIFEETEGTEVTVPPDFDPGAIRLTGNVSGEPPFKGTLRHHGWRVVRIELPQITVSPEKGYILAPAEVEIDA